MINRVVIVGRLTKDLVLRYTPNGVPLIRFTVAVNRPFANKEGDREADFIPCVAWRHHAQNLVNYTKKGHLIGVEGRIQTGSYEAEDGKKIFTTEILVESISFLEKKAKKSAQERQPEFTGFYTSPSA